MSRLLRLALLVTEPLIGRESAGTSLSLRLQNASGLHWVATLPRTASADDHGRVSVFARAERFTSSRLSREFSPLSFGTVSPQQRSLHEALEARRRSRRRH